MPSGFIPVTMEFRAGQARGYRRSGHRVGVFGAAVTVAGKLGQPLVVLVTEYVPCVVTVIEAVVAPLLHNIVPPEVIDNTELPQLFTTVTTGVGM